MQYKTGFITNEVKVKERIRLSEFSLLLAVLDVDPARFSFISLEEQGGFLTDIEGIRPVISLKGDREDQIVTAFLPSFRNYFPDHFLVERREESDYHPGVQEDKMFEFWSAFDTITYRFWILFHILKLKAFLYHEDHDIELLYWERFGGDLPSLGKEERRYLLYLRLFAAFFRGRALLYEKVLPAFLKKPVEVNENISSQNQVPEEYQIRLGKANSHLGRDFFPGKEFTENHSTFSVVVSALDKSNIAAFKPTGDGSGLLNNLMILFTPAHLRWRSGFKFREGLTLFTPGKQADTCYLGFSTYLRQTVSV